MNKNAKIYVAGHKGLVGSAILRNLIENGYTNLVYREPGELNLIHQKAVQDFFELEQPEYVILAAGKVGGIHANNTYRAQFLYENLMIECNIIHQSYLSKVKKLLFLGSSCIYPKDCPQPIIEEYLLTSPLEQTNEPYAIAKIAGIKMCENYFRQYGCNFISAMPTNLYGPNDNYNLETSHVFPALIRKMHLGKCLENHDWLSLRKDLSNRPIEGVDGRSTNEEILCVLSKYGIKLSDFDSAPIGAPQSGQDKSKVTISLWGTGQVYREFMHVDDLARACVKIMNEVDVKDCYFLNIGTGIDQTIHDLAFVIKDIIGFTGEIQFNHEKTDGTYKKLLDISRLNALNFKPFYSLVSGIEQVYQNYCR